MLKLKKTVQVYDYDVDRQVLDQMGHELRSYQSKRNRLSYLKMRLPQIFWESGGPSDGMPRGSQVSNPTHAKVEKAENVSEEIREIDAWLATVDRVCSALAEGQREIVNHLYLLPRAHREYTMVGLANRLSMSESEAYRTKDEALLEFLLVIHGTQFVTRVGGNQGEIREARSEKTV